MNRGQQQCLVRLRNRQRGQGSVKPAKVTAESEGFAPNHLQGLERTTADDQAVVVDTDMGVGSINNLSIEPNVHCGTVSPNELWLDASCG